MRFGLGLFVKHHLHNSRAVPHIQKQQIPQVAPPVYPAHDRGIAAGVASAQRPAVMCSFQTAEKVQHDGSFLTFSNLSP
jgi:hypothetical protein